MAVISSISQYLAYRRVFASHSDIQEYRRVRDNPSTFAGRRPARIKVKEAGNHPLLCRPGTMDPITMWDAFYYRYHLPESPLGDPQSIVDLGANAGYTAAHFAWLYPKARVVAVEMDADNIAVCGENLGHLGERCNLVHAAVWSSSGTVDYEGGNVHEYGIHRATGKSQTRRTAPSLTPHDLFSQYGLTSIDYLKMDIEGCEIEVLPLCLQHAHIRQMNVEVHPPATMDRCRELLESAGFACHPHPRHRRSICALRPH